MKGTIKSLIVRTSPYPRWGWTKVLKIVAKAALGKMLFSLRKRSVVFITLVNAMS